MSFNIKEEIEKLPLSKQHELRHILATNSWPGWDLLRLLGEESTLMTVGEEWVDDAMGYFNIPPHGTSFTG